MESTRCGRGCENSVWGAKPCAPEDRSDRPGDPAGYRAARRKGKYCAQGVCGRIRSGKPAAEGKREARVAGAGQSRSRCDSRELRKLGARVDVVEAYETVIPQASRQTAAGGASIVSTASGCALPLPVLLPCGILWRCWRRTAGRVGRVSTGTSLKRHLKGVRLASIGPVTSSTLRDLGLRVDIEAAEYTIPGLINAICKGEW